VTAPPIPIAEHVRQLGGGSPLLNLVEVKTREAQGRRRKAGSERSVDQKREPMNKNRIGGLLCGAKRQMTMKPIFTKNTGGKSGGCAEGGRTYFGRSAACHGIVTEDGVIHLDGAAGVSRGHSRPTKAEGPNSKERQVGRRTR
jgi:hypothetical protein